MPLRRGPVRSRAIGSGRRSLRKNVLSQPAGKHTSLRKAIRMLNEPKSAAVSGSTAPGTTWTEVMSSFDTILQGSSATSRDGNQIYATAMEFKALLTSSIAAGSNAYQGYRIVVVKPSGNYTVVAGDLPSNAMTGVYTRDQLAKYRVLYDRTFYQNKQSPTTGMETFVHKKIKLNHKMIYAQSSVSSPAKGRIQFFIVSDDNANSGDFAIDATLYFRDV